MNHYPAADTQFISMFDLRVIAGLHAGARIAIGESANDALTVGHGPECDVVLQDPALAEGHLTIRLVRTDEGFIRGWQASRGGMHAQDQQEEQETDQQADERTAPGASSEARAASAAASAIIPGEAGDVVALGEVMRWGGLGLTVAEQDTPWPSIDIMHEATIAGDAALASEATMARDAAGTPHQDGISGGDHAHDPIAKRRTEGKSDDADLTSNGDEMHLFDGPFDVSASAIILADSSDSTGGLPSDDTVNSTHPEKPKRLASRLRAWWSVIPAAVIVAIFSVVVVFLLGTLLIRILNGAGVSNAPVKVMSATANQSAAQVTKVIERLGLSSVLHLKTTSDGVVAVVGWVQDEAQRDKVASALAQLTPMPAMMVSIESEAVDTVQQIVKQYGTYIDVINQGGGQIRLIGLIEPAEARAQLETEFRSQLPTAVLLDDRLLDRDKMAAMLESRLNDTGMPELSVVWTTAGMLIDARRHSHGDSDSDRSDTASSTASSTLRSEQHRARSQVQNRRHKGRQDARQNERIDSDKVYAVVQAFKQQYGMRLPIFAHFNGEQAALAPRALPFNISSITGGPLPSVLVDDGWSVSGRQTRLLPGAIYRGYKLLSVSPQQVIFDGPQRVVVTR